MIDRLHRFADSLGIKPVVFDAFLAAVAYAAFNLVVYGNLALEDLRLAVGVLILGVVGIAAPPAAGVKHRDIANP